MNTLNLSGFTNLQDCLEKALPPVEGEIRHYKDGDYKFIQGKWKKVKQQEETKKEDKKYIKEKEVKEKKLLKPEDFGSNFWQTRDKKGVIGKFYHKGTEETNYYSIKPNKKGFELQRYSEWGGSLVPEGRLEIFKTSKEALNFAKKDHSDRVKEQKSREETRKLNYWRENN